MYLYDYILKSSLNLILKLIFDFIKTSLHNFVNVNNFKTSNEKYKK